MSNSLDSLQHTNYFRFFRLLVQNSMNEIAQYCRFRDAFRNNYIKGVVVIDVGKVKSGIVQKQNSVNGLRLLSKCMNTTS